MIGARRLQPKLITFFKIPTNLSFWKISSNIENKPSPAKVGSNKLSVHIGFDLSRIRQTQLWADKD